MLLRDRAKWARPVHCRRAGRLEGTGDTRDPVVLPDIMGSIVGQDGGCV
jgi:hypothetical protein